VSDRLPGVVPVRLGGEAEASSAPITAPEWITTRFPISQRSWMVALAWMRQSAPMVVPGPNVAAGEDVRPAADPDSLAMYARGYT